ncbi:MAG: DUF5301 domain-containing protein [Clostridiales bacterium]|nr:DUF5301 domain-containing protein [Clostridiales bacterium]
MRKYLIGLLCLLLALSFFGCSGGKKLELPTYAELQSITVQEVENGQPVSREVSLDDDLEFYQSNYPDDQYFSVKDYKQITDESKIPASEKSIAYRFTETGGNTRLLKIFSDDKYDYIEEPGIGVWRAKRPQKQWTQYALSYKKYSDKSWTQAFLDNAADKNFTLLPEYNGAAKAIFVDISEETVSDWVERFIPEAFAASRAEDVRYVVLCEVASKVYEGYWYVPETGERLDDSHDTQYRATAYDLVTGDTTVLVAQTMNGIFEITDYIDAYFTDIE